VAAVVSAEGINAFTPDSSHGRLLTALGFEVIDIEGTNQINEAGQGSRADVVSVSPENVVDLFGEATLLYVFAEPEQLPELVDVHPTLGLLPSTTEQRSVALGIDSFRLDRYSTANVVDRLVAAQS
jgi:ferric enterobactin transport system substrate-binding protein